MWKQGKVVEKMSATSSELDVPRVIERPRRRVVAKMPVIVRQPSGRKKTKHQTPQEIVDEFWQKFNTKKPGKGMDEASFDT